MLIQTRIQFALVDIKIGRGLVKQSNYNTIKYTIVLSGTQPDIQRLVPSPLHLYPQHFVKNEVIMVTYLYISFKIALPTTFNKWNDMTDMLL